MNGFIRALFWIVGSCIMRLVTVAGFYFILVLVFRPELTFANGLWMGVLSIALQELLLRCVGFYGMFDMFLTVIECHLKSMRNLGEETHDV